MIKNIREIATCTSTSLWRRIQPSAVDLHGVINDVALPNSIEDDARILLDALVSIIPANSDLLYSA